MPLPKSGCGSMPCEAMASKVLAVGNASMALKGAPQYGSKVTQRVLSFRQKWVELKSFPDFSYLPTMQWCTTLFFIFICWFYSKFTECTARFCFSYAFGWLSPRNVKYWKTGRAKSKNTFSSYLTSTPSILSIFFTVHWS
jgi:hypothetical protein